MFNYYKEKGTNLKKRKDFKQSFNFMPSKKKAKERKKIIYNFYFYTIYM